MCSLSTRIIRNTRTAEHLLPQFLQLLSPFVQHPGGKFQVSVMQAEHENRSCILCSCSLER